ncbi:MAG: DUF4465 domain-containing protein, partial [Bacteroidia bacterium]
MKNKFYKTALALGIAVFLCTNLSAQTATFEDITLQGANDYKIPSTGTVDSKFTSGSFEFKNSYDISFGGYWTSGWAYSKTNDTLVGDYTNLYASYANKGFENSNNYAVSQNNSYLKLKQNSVKGIYVSNTTYAALCLKNGNTFAKKFGGTTGNDSDWFKLTIYAYQNGNLKTEKAEFYLADFRFQNNAQDYIIKDWTYVNLQSLGSLDSLKFTLTSSDTGQFGMNTPAFFCVDNIITNTDTASFENLIIPYGQDYWNRGSKVFTEEYISGSAYFRSSYSVSPSYNYWSKGFAISNSNDSTTQGFTNLYSSANGKGYNKSANYAVSNGNNTLITAQGKGIADAGIIAKGIWINNGTYPYFSMLNGDGFAKKFGGTSGDEADYFRVIIRGYLRNVKTTDSVIFYLADYRNSDNSKDYILKDWAYADLSKFGYVDSISFKLESTDNGQFGMNTPAFFCIDNFEYDYKTGVNEIANQRSFSIYPNPSSSTINIDFNERFSTIKIIDIQGKMVLQSNQKTIDINGLENGIYIVQIATENGILNSKF